MTGRAGATALLAAAVLAFGVGGAAEAGRLLTGRHVLDGSLGGVDLRDGSLTARDVADASIRPEHYDGASVGPPGAAGVPGPTGERGRPGRSGVRGTVTTRSNTHVVDPTETARLVAYCPYGTAAVSGGVDVDAYAGQARLTNSAPTDDGSAWVVHLRNGGTGKTSVEGYAVCIATAPPVIGLTARDRR